ncbi:FAD-dependent oxidoreductase [Jiella sonneratiae]|uniref:FAD-dependent oxidoreductase n=1 Tax=Jiella sonneratiae TaxID=2816856 RepID=A0ABS3J410_9HYPH|nr:FAD-dependent oxidoreductase [Jiella sonneratiae]MBO0904394.1 FAD-dependent oxidoreductase [Jiella sonneratiae]
MHDIVLVGGGHAHLFVLEAFAKRPLDDVRLTLVAREAFAPYSGMLPGRVSGQYPIDAGEIDLQRLAGRAGARFIHAAATAIDCGRREVAVEGHPPIPYSLLSLDIGIVPDVSAIGGAEAHGLLVKPISTFRQRFERLVDGLDDGRIRHLAVVGGGPAGFELAQALRRRANFSAACKGHNVAITLAAGTTLLAGLPERARRLARHSLQDAGIGCIEGARVASIGPGRVVLDDGRQIDADEAIVTTAAAAPALFRDAGLAVDGGGFLAVRPTLESASDDRIFGAGDCVGLLGQERPKAGVFAVREGVVLAENLRRAALGRPLRRYRAQKAHLMLLALSDGDAIAVRGRLALQSSIAFRLKDWIDRGFVDRFSAR